MTDIEIHRTQIDQVTTLWVEAPPPLLAGLYFRTGQADETLATAGITHLIEHLVFSTLDEPPGSTYNGWVGASATGFFKRGQPREVASFLSSVCSALSSLPAEKLESEKQVLAAEYAAKPYDFYAALLRKRYGAAGHGLRGMPQLGIRGATIEELKEYAAQRFTQENAVLWLSGPPPGDLSLKLPHGSKLSLPTLTPCVPAFPTWYLDNQFGGAAVGATVPRVSAATIFCEIARKRLYQRLRTDKALSYAPNFIYEPLNADTAHLVLYADSDLEHRKELAEVFGEVYKELSQVEPSEVEAARTQILENWTGNLKPQPADYLQNEVHRAARDWIHEKEFELMEQLATKLLSVSVEEVAAFGSEMQKTAIFALPGGAIVQPWFGWVATISYFADPRSREILSIDAPKNQSRLVLNPDGVSVRFSLVNNLTVRWSELEAALFYEDGGVVLIGRDATWLQIEPTLWRGGKSICNQIRKQVPPDLVLDQGARPADAIPKPSTNLWQRLLSFL